MIGSVSGTEFVWETAELGDFYTSYGMDITVGLVGYDDLEVIIIIWAYASSVFYYTTSLSNADIIILKLTYLCFFFYFSRNIGNIHRIPE